MIVLKCLSYFLLALILLIIILLFIPLWARITVTSNEVIKVKAGAGIIGIKLVPKKKKKKVNLKAFTYEKHQKRLKKEQQKKLKKAEKKAKKKNKSEINDNVLKSSRDQKPKTPLLKKIKKFLPMVKFGLSQVPSLFKGFKISIYNMALTIGCDEAKDTAVRFAEISGAFPILIELIKSIFTVKHIGTLNTYSDFEHAKTSVDVDLKVEFRIITIVVIGIRFLVWYIKHGTNKETTNENNSNVNTNSQAEENNTQI